MALGGIGEKDVNIVQKLMKKLMLPKENFCLVHLNYWSPPLEQKRCLSKTLVGRKLCWRMPEFEPQVPDEL